MKNVGLVLEILDGFFGMCSDVFKVRVFAIAKTPVLNSTPPVLWEVNTKLVLILTPVGVSFTIWCVI